MVLAIKMSKLQQIERKNGSILNSVNLPKEELERLDWEKGDGLKITAQPEGNPTYLKIEKEVEKNDSKI